MVPSQHPKSITHADNMSVTCKVTCHLSCRPIPQEPKPDPLGRNLNREKQQELPPGYDPPGLEAAESLKGEGSGFRVQGSVS
jgi:hypothetical protein